MQNGVILENDPQLMQAFREGKDEALKKLLDMFHTGLKFFARNLVKNHEDSEEIVSDSFIKLFKKHADFETLQNIKAFLYIATRNACLDKIRANQIAAKRIGNVISLSENEEAYKSFELIPDDPNEYSLQTDLIVTISELMKTLPDQCRKIFKMRFLEKMKIKDIASELGIAENTVSTQIGIAKNKLRALLLLVSLLLLIKSVITSFIK